MNTKKNFWIPLTSWATICYLAFIRFVSNRSVCSVHGYGNWKRKTYLESVQVIRLVSAHYSFAGLTTAPISDAGRAKGKKWKGIAPWSGGALNTCYNTELPQSSNLQDSALRQWHKSYNPHWNSIISFRLISTRLGVRYEARMLYQTVTDFLVQMFTRDCTVKCYYRIE